MIKNIAVLILFFFSFCYGISNDVFFKNLNKKYEKIKTYKAEFEQLNYWSELDTDKTSNGYFYYSDENIALDYFNPKGQKMVIDNTGVLVYDVSSCQLIKTKSDYVINKIKPIEIINYYKENSKISIKKDEDSYVLTMYPIKDEQDITKVVISVNSKTWLINNLTYTDNLNNWVKYKFFKHKINLKIPIDVFIIKTPKNVNIIDQRY